MWRVLTSTFATLTLFSSVALAQAPCTPDANRVVAEVYRHSLERGVDQAAQNWARQLANGQINVKEFVRAVAKSPEHAQRFGQAEGGLQNVFGQPYERAVANLYRHVLGRQPDDGGLRNYTRVAQQRGLAAVVDGLIDSAEYTKSFGELGVPGSGGMRFCGPSANTESSAPIAPRFRGMDRNGDGIITQREWQGNAVAFDNQDTNNDGVLSGAEVRAEGRGRGRRAGDYDFDALDINNNNRIERREWLARLDQFNRLDVNADNFLSRAELEGGDDVVGTAGRVIAVGGDRQWVDTGINLRAGQTMTINADGRIRLSRDTRDSATAAGVTLGRRVEGAAIPSAPRGSLVARIGDGTPVFIGMNRTLRVPQAGRLYLGVNDDFFDDNTGQYNVTVDVN